MRWCIQRRSFMLLLPGYSFTTVDILCLLSVRRPAIFFDSIWAQCPSFEHMQRVHAILAESATNAPNEQATCAPRHPSFKRDARRLTSQVVSALSAPMSRTDRPTPFIRPDLSLPYVLTWHGRASSRDTDSMLAPRSSRPTSTRAQQCRTSDPVPSFRDTSSRSGRSCVPVLVGVSWGG